MNGKMSRLSKRELLSLPVNTRAEMAMKAAVKKIIEEHARLGLPLYVAGRNGGVVKVSAKAFLRKRRIKPRSKTRSR